MICVRLLGTYSTVVTTVLLHVIQVVPVGPGPIFPWRVGPCPGAGDVITVVRGAAGGGTAANPGGGGGLSPKYEGGGAGLGLVCS